MIVKNNKYQKEWHNATKPLKIEQKGSSPAGGRRHKVGGRGRQRQGKKRGESGQSLPQGQTRQLSQEQSTGERRSGRATPAVQRGSVPRMLLLGLNS
jgi:hypothetical protein